MSALSWLDESEDYEDRRATIASLVAAGHDARTRADLRTIYLFLTRKCNLACQHCYIEGVGPKARDDDFGIEAVRAVIEQALPAGLRKVKVSGGEPLVHRDFEKILSFLSECGLDELVLETNATLIKPDTIELLARVPNLTVFVSLDHISPEEHDEFRGKRGAYEVTIGATRQLCNAGVRTIVTTTAYQKNFSRVADIIDLVIDWGAWKHRTLLNIHPIGNARQHKANALTLAECESLISGLLANEHFRSGRAYMTLPPALMPIHQLKSISTCGWGESVVGVMSDGSVSMCSASYDDPKMIAGNLREANLIEIWRDSDFFKELREVRTTTAKGVCGNCVFYEACGGVCKMSSWAHYGEKDAPYPLCQEIYNAGKFPKYALRDPDADCSYKPDTISPFRV